MSDGRTAAPGGAEGAQEQPVWDGLGFDPWLPQRLRDAAIVAGAEQEMFAGFWSILSQFLVAVVRAVMASSVPDPSQVLVASALWNRLVDEFAATTVREVMGSAYRAIFGPDFEYSGRPAVAAHLAEVDNRLRGVDNEVFNQVARTVARSVAEGWSIPQTAAAVEEVMSPGNPMWMNRATVVARTETISALNAGRTDSFRQIQEDVPELEFRQQWLATLDARVRDTHRRADGQQIPLGPRETFAVGTADLRFPGDPRGPAQEVIQCRCTTILVEAGREVSMVNRGFN